MKTIKTLVEIPAKYKWMAQDEGGYWWVYTMKPKPSIEEWHRNLGNNSDMMQIGMGNPNPHWRNTLTRIAEYEEVE